MANLFRLTALVLLALCGFSAHASIPPTTSTEYNCGYGWYPSINAAMAAHPSTQTGMFGAPYSFSAGNCIATRLSTGVPTVVNGGTTRSTSSCPANSTLAGSVCNCNSGFEQQGNVCVNPNEALCNALNGSETYASAPGNIAPGASSCNASGCMTTFASTLIRVKNAQGQYVTEGAATFTGATCTYSEASGSTEDTCPGGSKGEVNGVTVCVPYDPKLNTIETVGGSESTTTEGGDTTTTGTTSTTTCANGSCTTTTNVTTTVNGGTPSTKTTTTNEPQSDFCTKNPRAAQCTEGGQFGGSCGSFSCSGDAVQCALTLEVHRQHCKLNQTTEESALYLTEKGKEGSQTGDLPGNETISFGPGSYDDSNALGAGACITDLSVNVWGVSVTLPLTMICPYLLWFKWALLAFASIAWLVIVFRK